MAKEMRQQQKHIVRDIFVILLCAAVIAIAVSVIADRAASTFNPYFGPRVSEIGAAAAAAADPVFRVSDQHANPGVASKSNSGNAPAADTGTEAKPVTPFAAVANPEPKANSKPRAAAQDSQSQIQTNPGPFSDPEPKKLPGTASELVPKLGPVPNLDAEQAAAADPEHKTEKEPKQEQIPEPDDFRRPDAVHTPDQSSETETVKNAEQSPKAGTLEQHEQRREPDAAPDLEAAVVGKQKQSSVTTADQNPEPERKSGADAESGGSLGERLELDDLDSVLAAAADDNKTVILTALNRAWAEPNSMIDLFLESFRIGDGTSQLLQHVLIVCLDAKAYNRCINIHPHCYRLSTRGIDFSAEKVFMSHDYLIMMWRRLGFLGEILKRGYSFVFSDCDIMWLRNPFKIFAEDADIQIAADRFNGAPYDVQNLPNGGYKYVRSNERSVSFYKFWYMSRRLFPGQNEQDVLNILKFRGSFKKMVNFRFLDTKNFGGFCERSNSLNDVYTMHANCCKGLKAKLIDLRQTLQDWRNYMQPPPNSTQDLSVWRPPYACQQSWFQ